MRHPRRYRKSPPMHSTSLTGPVAQRTVDAFADDALAAARGTYERLRLARGADVEAMMAKAFVDSFPTHATAEQISLALVRRSQVIRGDVGLVERIIGELIADAVSGEVARG